ncbi:MAG: VOC family protein [Bdellovibrionales bacterium]|nr:VOC family protein [Bdellovibrionales bacterium]
MKIGHVHLKVRNLKRSEAFYRELLGAHETERVNGHFVFLSMGESHHELALQEIGEAGRLPTPDTVGLYHSAFEVADSTELLTAIERVKQLETPYVLVDHGISWAVYFSDPDGNGVEVYLDRRDAPHGAKDWSGKSRKLSIHEIENAR